MGGGWVGVKTWILVLSSKPKFNNILKIKPVDSVLTFLLWSGEFAQLSKTGSEPGG